MSEELRIVPNTLTNCVRAACEQKALFWQMQRENERRGDTTRELVDCAMDRLVEKLARMAWEDEE